MSANIRVGYELSPWAREYLSERETSTSMPCKRRASYTCSSEELKELLTSYDLPTSGPIIDFEESAGGWCAEEPTHLWGLGVCLSLRAVGGGHPIARQFLLNRRWFCDAAERQAGPIDWSYLPLRGEGYPRTFYRDRALVPLGMTGEEHVYFIGQGGEIYLFITSLDQLYLVAGCGRTLFERLGLYHQKVGKRFFEAHICRNVADRIADRLGVPRLDCASDDYFTVWANDSVQIRLVQDSGPNIFGTHLAIVDPEQFLGAMSALRSEESGVELVLWGGANNIDDAGGLALLERAGIKADVRFGPGPGNYDFTIDPDTGEAVYIASSYDSTDWT